MATMREFNKILDAMIKAKEFNVRSWVGKITIDYIEHLKKYIATFDSDLEIVYDGIEFKGNGIYFWVELNDVKIDIANVHYKDLY